MCPKSTDFVQNDRSTPDNGRSGRRSAMAPVCQIQPVLQQEISVVSHPIKPAGSLLVIFNASPRNLIRFGGILVIERFDQVLGRLWTCV